MKKKLNIGDVVTITGDSGFCNRSQEKIKDIKTQYNEKTGEPCEIYVIQSGQKFDLRGHAITSPLAYYIEELACDHQEEFVKVPSSEKMKKLALCLKRKPR